MDIEILGLIAATLTTSAFIPQTYKVVKTKSAKDFSWLWLIFMLLGISLWFTYGLLINNIPLIFSNSITMINLIIMLVVKYVYRQS
ncbi:MAG: SemiSWEET family sugar transporter [Sulfurihydrogenibium sp.]|jgi:MtN3 and saliva related transmembrane protein|uniref:SemiSWEET family sugar transporter n=1 Tax=Sulfurihydrogenibium sp. TaxID=2053621 RepID=UPI003C7987CE